MNKKCLVYILSITLLIVSRPSFSMYGAIFKAARAVGMTTVPACGLYLCNESNKRDRNGDEFFETSPLISETAIEKWGKEKMAELNVANAESISFVYGLGWGTCKEKFITVPRSESYQLSKALQLKNKSFFGDLFYNIRFLGDDPDKTIARHSMLLKHEIGHIINKDDHNSSFNLATIPVAVEAASFGVTSAFRKLYSMQAPKTFVKTALRSCFAVGAIVPKALISGAAYIFSMKYQEKRADTFACKNAASRLELEEFENFFQESINKRTNRNIKENEVGSLMFFYFLSGRFDLIPKTFRKECIEYSEKGLKGIARQLNDPDVSEQRKKILNNILQVVHDPHHPCREKRVANIRKYIDKWDREHSGEKS